MWDSSHLYPPSSSLAPSGRVYWAKLFGVVSAVNARLFCVSRMDLEFFLSWIMSSVLGNGLVFSFFF